MALRLEITVPLLSVNDTSISVVEIIFQNGDHVKKDEVIIILETSKTTYDVTASTDGYIKYLCEPGNEYEVNQKIAEIFSDRSDIDLVTEKKQSVKKTAIIGKDEISPPAPLFAGDTLFSPAALTLINSQGIDPSIFAGRDFVSKYDVENLPAINGKKFGGGYEVPPEKKITVQPDADRVNIEKIAVNKRREIAYLSDVQSAGLTSTVNSMVETAGIFNHMNQSLRYLKHALLPVTIYETARLLSKYPRLNAYFSREGLAIYKEVNIGFAIDVDKGLKVLRIENASKKTISEIEDGIIELSGKYLDDGLQVNEVAGITFTITDLSSEDVMSFTPLVNAMNSAILGISSVDKKLNRCILSLTFDHRVTEGKMAAQFLKELKDRLESYRPALYTDFPSTVVCFKCMKTLQDDISDVGFVKCITPAGNEAFICQSCLKGF